MCLFFRCCAKYSCQLVQLLSMGLIQIPNEKLSTEANQVFLCCLISISYAVSHRMELS